MESSFVNEYRFLGLEGRLWIDHPGPQFAAEKSEAHRNVRSQQRIRTGCSVSVSLSGVWYIVA